MDRGATDAAPEATRVPPAPDVPATRRSLASAPPPARDRRLGRDLAVIALITSVVLGALAAAGVLLYREFYSPSAFVRHYLHLLHDNRAAEALAVPGVAIDTAELDAAGLEIPDSDALLRAAAMGTLTDVAIVSEEAGADVTEVRAEFDAGGVAGSVSFDVEHTGWIGIVPTWSFATSPLAVIDLTVDGSMKFSVNGFDIDKRQVSPDGVDADPSAPISMLVFSPGLYSVSVDTAIASTPGVAVLSDAPLTEVPVTVAAEPTEEFIAVVQERVEGFLTSCATQEVLQPTACPFGYTVEDRIVGLPSWTISSQPTVTVEPEGDVWKIPATPASARIDVQIQSLFDGSIREVSEEVPFLVTGTITVLPDGTASIVVGGG
ncbi:hypothetical protein [Microbacterium xanthum]|uniref:hypothetical protein n=1 Tax=Microbacterium xanthum TaxID=3079794 RepID=UPI002AD545E8|nr:hypothetical protein [Microbacterium sp. KSW-48]MDZ8173022.1 hypothetical protein [Microbacterium sp. KSW-48]